jgi:hypothetical protein
VDHQDDRLIRHDGLEPGIQVPGVVDETVPPVWSGAGLAHAGEVRPSGR